MYTSYPGSLGFYQTRDFNKVDLSLKYHQDFQNSLTSENQNLSKISPSIPIRSSRRNRKLEQNAQSLQKWKRLGNSFTRLVMLAACSYYTISFLIDYFKYPTVMTMHKDENEWATFPTIVLCNTNKIQKSYFCERAAATDREAIKWKVLEGATQHLRHICHRPPDYEFLEIDLRQFDCPNVKSQVFSKLMSFYDFYLLLTEEEKTAASQKESDFIQTCLFNSYKCSHENFTRLKTGSFGNNCFRTNFDVKSHSYGFVSGLTLMYNVDEKEHLATVSIMTSLGLTVEVAEDQKITPQLYSELFQVAPNRFTYVSMNQIYEKRLKKPYIDKCQGDNWASKMRCIDDCWNSFAKKKCNCKDPLVNYPNTDDICALTNTTQKCCLSSVREDLLANMVDCNCSHACESVHYTVSQSSEILNVSYTAFLMPRENRRPREINDTGIGMLHFYLRTSDVLKYESNPKYLAADFFSNLGGQLGLWLGLCLADIFSGFYSKVLYKIFTMKDQHGVSNKNMKVQQSKLNSMFYSRNRSA